MVQSLQETERIINTIISSLQNVVADLNQGLQQLNENKEKTINSARQNQQAKRRRQRRQRRPTYRRHESVPSSTPTPILPQEY
jgi:cell shape-determining protein MreC